MICTLASPIAAPGGAQADDSVVVVVADFRGPGSGSVRTSVVRAFSRSGSVVLYPSEELQAAEERLGSLGDAMREAGVHAYVDGSVRRRGRRYQLRITVQNDAGDMMGNTTIKGRGTRGLRRAVERSIADRLETAVAEARATATVAPVEEEEEATDEEGSSDDDAPSRVVVVRAFEGPSGERVSGWVEGLLTEEGIEVLPSSELEDIASERGLDLLTATGNASAAEALEADAIVDGFVERSGRSFRATVTVRNGLDGSVQAEERFMGRGLTGLRGALTLELWGSIGDAIEASSAPGRQADVAEESANQEELDAELEPDEGEYTSSEDPGDDVGVGGPLLDVGIGARFVTREFSYNDRLSDQLRGYSLGGAPAIYIESLWHPAAHFTDGLLANFGVRIYGELLIAVDSVSKDAEDGSTFSTNASAFGATLRYLIPIGDLYFAPQVGYGVQSFSIDEGPSGPTLNTDTPVGTTLSLVPDVSYSFVRLGLEGGYQLFSGLGLHGSFSWLVVGGSGEFGNDDWFPRSTTDGIEAHLGVGYHLTSAFELQVSADVRRYFSTLNPEPGDMFVAGGALDQYLGGSFGITWHTR